MGKKKDYFLRKRGIQGRKDKGTISELPNFPLRSTEGSISAKAGCQSTIKIIRTLNPIK